MKKLGLLLLALFFNVLISNAQENQAELAEKWTEGEYEYYTVSFDNFTKKDEKVKLSFERKNNMITTVKIGYNQFEHRFSKWHPFVRYYYSVGISDEVLYFTGSSIVLIRLKENEVVSEISGCLGKKVNAKKTKDTFQAHIKDTRKYEAVTTLVNNGGMITSIDLVAIGKDSLNLTPESEFEVGMICHTRGGMDMYSSNLGGSLPYSQFVLNSNGVKAIRKRDDAYLILKPICAGTSNNQIVFTIGIRSSDTYTFSASLKVNCDNDQSDAMVKMRKWQSYEEIAFMFTDKNYKSEEKIIKMDNGGGFASSSKLIDNLYEKRQPDFLPVRVKKNGKYGYTNKNGDIIIPIEYDGGTISFFYNKIITVQKNDKWGLVDEKNKIVLPLEYDALDNMVYGICGVKKNKKIAFVNKTGKFVTDFIYDNYFSFSDFKIAMVVKDGLRGYINTDGVKLTECIYEDARDHLKNGLAAVKKGGKWGAVNLKGLEITPFEFDGVYDVSSSEYICVMKNNKYGLMDGKGKLVLPIEYDFISQFSDGSTESFVRVKKNSLYGFVKKDGSFLVPCTYSKAYDFVNDEAKIEKPNPDYDALDPAKAKNSSFLEGTLYTSGKEFWKDGSSGEDYSASSNSGKANTTKTKSTSSNTSTGDNFTGNVYFKYDMMGKDKPGERLYIHSGANALSITSTGSGSKALVGCEKGKVYYSFTGKKADMKLIKELSSDDCGKTLNYTDFK